MIFHFNFEKRIRLHEYSLTVAVSDAPSFTKWVSLEKIPPDATYDDYDDYARFLEFSDTYPEKNVRIPLLIIGIHETFCLYDSMNGAKFITMFSFDWEFYICSNKQTGQLFFFIHDPDAGDIKKHFFPDKITEGDFLCETQEMSVFMDFCESIVLFDAPSGEVLEKISMDTPKQRYKMHLITKVNDKLILGLALTPISSL